MKVHEIMKTKVVTIPESATYQEAAHILHSHTVSGAPVVSDDNKLVGVLSEKDLFRVLYPFYSSYHEHPEMYTDHEAREYKIDEVKHKGIEDFISQEVHTAEPHMPVMKVGGLLLAKGIHRMPVVETDSAADSDHEPHGKLIGIVSRRDIYTRVVADHLGL